MHQRDEKNPGCGLFDTDDEEQELAFRLAVEFFNKNKAGRPHPQLVAQVERIANGDIYDATKKVCSLLEMGVAAIFGPQDHLTSLHVGSICDEVEVPHIETRWDYKIKRDDLSINLHPSPSVLSESYVTMVKEMGWQNFTLIYEGNYEFHSNGQRLLFHHVEGSQWAECSSYLRTLCAHHFPYQQHLFEFHLDWRSTIPLMP
ncbi:glutamate receptor ionotropic, kainate 1 [Trichonephila clavipes]|nr:glutamate receptor ionotropic, kainate 1 [Trichonephila clavipes]